MDVNFSENLKSQGLSIQKYIFSSIENNFWRIYLKFNVNAAFICPTVILQFCSAVNSRFRETNYFN